MPDENEKNLKKRKLDAIEENKKTEVPDRKVDKDNSNKKRKCNFTGNGGLEIATEYSEICQEHRELFEVYKKDFPCYVQGELSPEATEAFENKFFYGIRWKYIYLFGKVDNTYRLLSICDIPNSPELFPGFTEIVRSNDPARNFIRYYIEKDLIKKQDYYCKGGILALAVNKELSTLLQIKKMHTFVAVSVSKQRNENIMRQKQQSFAYTSLFPVPYTQSIPLTPALIKIIVGTNAWLNNLIAQHYEQTGEILMQEMIYPAFEKWSLSYISPIEVAVINAQYLDNIALLQTITQKQTQVAPLFDSASNTSNTTTTTTSSASIVAPIHFYPQMSDTRFTALTPEYIKIIIGINAWLDRAMRQHYLETGEFLTQEEVYAVFEKWSPTHKMDSIERTVINAQYLDSIALIQAITQKQTQAAPLPTLTPNIPSDTTKVAELCGHSLAKILNSPTGVSKNDGFAPDDFTEEKWGLNQQNSALYPK